MINLSKKILFITGRSDVGGGPQHLFDLAVLLKKKGVVLYIASPSDSPFLKSLNPFLINILLSLEER